MTAYRYSLKQALAATRGARSSVARSAVRYGNRFEINARLELALAALNRAERELRLAVRDALARRERNAHRRSSAA